MLFPIPLRQSNERKKNEYSLNSREKTCFRNPKEPSNHNSLVPNQKLKNETDHDGLNMKYKQKSEHLSHVGWHSLERNKEGKKNTMLIGL